MDSSSIIVVCLRSSSDLFSSKIWLDAENIDGEGNISLSMEI